MPNRMTHTCHVIQLNINTQATHLNLTIASRHSLFKNVEHTRIDTVIETSKIHEIWTEN